MKILGHPAEDHDIYAGKRFRDEIHLDIHLSPLEVRVIDTPQFQRLDNLKQLGTAYLLYRGAKHSRFQHSLGAVAMTQQLIDIVNNKASSDEDKIPPKAQIIARMCALVHDIAHIPFGHSLEDEARVVSSPHDSKERLEPAIGQGTLIGKILGTELQTHMLSTLTAKTQDDVHRLEYPYVADMVFNTICADLLDYVLRDIKNTGLVATYDPRFLSYFVLAPDERGCKRMVVRLWRRQARGLRQEVVSDIIHLLRQRCMLAEKVYYHPNKMLTSAMISKAVQSAEIPVEELMKLGDDQLLARLADSRITKNKTATKLAQNLQDRVLYKPLYWVRAVREDDTDPKWLAIRELAREYHDHPKRRANMEAMLDKMAFLDEGSTIIYCPDLSMQLKPAMVLVQLPDERVLPLEKLANPEVAGEVERIKEQHKELWHFYVFIAPKYWSEDLVSADAARLNAVCIEKFKLPNENKEFPYVGVTAYERLVEEFCYEEEATSVELVTLKQMRRKLEDDHFWDDPKSYLKNQLEDLRKKKIEGKLL